MPGYGHRPAAAPGGRPVGEAHILVHFSVQKILVNRHELVVENFVEVSNNVWVAFHWAVSAVVKFQAGLYRNIGI